MIRITHDDYEHMSRLIEMYSYGLFFEEIEPIADCIDWSHVCSDGYTLVTKAAFLGNSESLALMLELSSELEKSKQINLALKDQHGGRAIDYAIEQRHAKVVQILLFYGATVWET